MLDVRSGGSGSPIPCGSQAARRRLRSPGLGLVLAALAAPAEGLAQVENGDPGAGKAVFEQCTTCHTIGQQPGSNTGPSLNGVMGRRAASVPGFNYSPQLRSSRIVWDVPYLSRFLKGPKNFIPGTRMLFNGLASPTDIADVIAYIAQFDENGALKQ